MARKLRIGISALCVFSFLTFSISAGTVYSRAANPSCTPTQLTYGNYVSQTFTAVGTCDWVVPSGAGTVDVLIVAGGGGGGGGAFAGGGGAGGFVEKIGLSLTPNSTMPIVVGAGGSGGTADIGTNRPPANNGANGGNSSFNSIIASGGGGGAGYLTFGTDPRTTANGVAGGSGGGGSEGSLSGGAATQLSYGGSGFGNAGGFSSSLNGQTGGGGGGAGGAGGNGSGSFGIGGAGKTSSFQTGSALTYAKGGDGGNYSATVAADAPANSGDGAKGASYNGTARVGGAGGSGIVVIRWSTVAPVVAPGTPGMPVVVAGNSQATVTVVAPSAGDSPTSYTVTASPGGATCTVTGASGSCTLTGLTNGTSYTASVTASNSGGTSGASLASDIFCPAAPNVNPTATITLGAPVGQPISGSNASIIASGLQATAAFTFVLRSTPQTLLSGNASAGAVNSQAVIPAGLEPGWHSLTFSSTSANGLPFVTTMYFEVSANGILTSTSTNEPTDNVSELVVTGFRASSVGTIAAVLIFSGLALVIGLRVFRRRNYD